MKRRTADLGLTLVAILWGLSYVFTKKGLDTGIAPLFINTSRFVISTLIIGFVYRDKIKTITREEFNKFFFLGIILALGYFAHTIGTKNTTLTKAAFYTALNIIFVPYISWMFERKSPSIYTYMSTMIALVGLLTISYVPAKDLIQFNLGDILVIIAASFFGAQIAITGAYSKKYDISKIMIVEFGTVAVFYILLTILALIFPLGIDPGIQKLDLNQILIIGYIAVIGTCLCMFMQSLFQKYTEATKASIILSTEAIFSLIFAVFMLSEALTTNVYIGGFIVMVAVILSELKSE